MEHKGFSKELLNNYYVENSSKHKAQSKRYLALKGRLEEITIECAKKGKGIAITSFWGLHYKDEVLHQLEQYFNELELEFAYRQELVGEALRTIIRISGWHNIE